MRRVIIKDILWGFGLALLGTWLIGLFGIAVFSFIKVANATGWASILWFFAGVFAVCSALIMFWFWGAESRERARIAKEYHDTSSTAPDKIEKF